MGENIFSEYKKGSGYSGYTQFEEETDEEKSKIEKIIQLKKSNLNQSQISKVVCDYQLKDRYTLGKKVGEGGYSVVYEAMDTKTNSKVALKKFKHKDSYEFDTYFESSTLREINILKKLNHENVIPLLDEFIVGDDQFVVFPFYEKNLVETGELPLAVVRKIMFQLLTGLKYLHEKGGIVHRDIKMNNIMFNPATEKIVIIDFGLMRDFKVNEFPYGKRKRPFTPGKQTGSFFYKAPELMKNSSSYNAKCDIWSAGVVFRYILTSKGPLHGKYTNEECFKYCENRYCSDGKVLKEIDRIDKDAGDLFRKLIDFDENKRITAREALKHSFFTSTRELSCEEINKLKD